MGRSGCLKCHLRRMSRTKVERGLSAPWFSPVLTCSLGLNMSSPVLLYFVHWKPTQTKFFREQHKTSSFWNTYSQSGLCLFSESSRFPWKWRQALNCGTQSSERGWHRHGCLPLPKYLVFLQNYRYINRRQRPFCLSVISSLFPDRANNFRFCKGSNLHILAVSAATKCSPKADRPLCRNSLHLTSISLTMAKACSQMLDCTSCTQSKLASKSNRAVTAHGKTCPGPSSVLWQLGHAELLAASSHADEFKYICGN